MKFVKIPVFILAVLLITTSVVAQSSEKPKRQKVENIDADLPVQI